jgi:hypothetical protein
MRGSDRRDERSPELFEQLWLLRHCYPLRSAYDAAGSLSVAQAIEHGERLMRQARWQERRQWRGQSRTAA